jgi:hypothetical protein
MGKVKDYLQNKRNHTNWNGTELMHLGYAKTVKTFCPRIEAVTKIIE